MFRSSVLLTVAVLALFSPSPSAFAAEQWETLLEQAEPLYSAHNYTAALPLYEQAAKATEASNAKGKVQCLNYLGDCLCRVRKPKEALAVYQQALQLIPADAVAERARNMNCQAFCLSSDNDYSKAESMCRSVLALTQGTDHDIAWEHARAQAQLGYFQYLNAKYNTAIPMFEQAEKDIDAAARTDVRGQALHQKLALAEAGSYYHMRDYDKAYAGFKRVAEYDSRLFGNISLQTGWALMGMSDAGDKIKKTQEARDCYRKAVYIFRRHEADRLCAQYDPEGKDAHIRERIEYAIFGNTKPPADLADAQEPLCKDERKLEGGHDPLRLYVPLFTEAPGRAWLNPTVPLKGIIIAIHGLSLQHSSYDALATKLADAGYATVAFDVRGFGSYQQALGADRLDFDGCMRDLQWMVGSIHRDRPDVPLYVMGESMGGAIALQFVSQNPDLCDGLIASVPAGKRFKQAKSTVKTAVHFFENRNRPFDIGTDVINQATKDQNLKDVWGNDPRTRGMLTARELLAFQLLCNRNLEFAKRITDKPVIIFQGLSDELIKPESTYDLFRAIKCKDKSMIMVGNLEHLIFEENCFTQPVLKEIVAWMDAHPKPSATIEK